MSPQTQLFHEDFRDALRHAIKALGGVEVVGADLWPSKTRKAAGTWLSDCLNPERPAKLELEEIVQILDMARAEGIHCALHQLCDETGYHRPEIAPAKTPRQELVAEIERTLAKLRHLTEQEAALDRATDRRVRSV